MTPSQNNSANDARNIILLSARSAVTRSVATLLADIYGFDLIKASKIPASRELPSNKRFVITAGKSDLSPQLKKMGYPIFLNASPASHLELNGIIELRQLSTSLNLQAKAEILSDFAHYSLPIGGLDHGAVAERVFDAACEAFVAEEDLSEDSKVA